MLLQWATLTPVGPDNLAALKFPSAVRIHSISIFPSNHQPFALSPEIVSCTEPDGFFLDLYFNAHPVVPKGSKDKVRPTNALFTTSIAYAGGCMDFKVNMNSDTATRLMIVKGSFESVSMAIYGEVVDELPPPASTYEPKSLPTLDPIPLSETLDPANFRDPSKLATQLLELIPDAPSLPLITRLMFCIKPSNDDWDLPEFPYLYAQLGELPEGADMQEAYKLASHPLPDDKPDASYVEFAEKIARGIGPANDTQSYYLASILSDAACQPVSMVSALLENLDLTAILDPLTLDEDTLDKLLDAASNTAVARRFNDPSFREVISSVEKNSKNDKFTRARARELLSRIDGMLILEDAISNTQGDFTVAAETLRSVGSQEKPLGILLATFLTHPDLVDTLAENPTQSASLQSLPRLFSDSGMIVSHDEFIAFLRAFIGVASLLAVYAWADSLPNVHCRERALGILRLWQGVGGYREILNHLLLLRQMVYRLDCALDTEVPTKAGVYAENIVLDLAKDPSSLLRPVFREAILKFELPHCVITDAEQQSMQRAADIADRGLESAVEYLLQPVERLPTFEYVRALRVALKIIDDELNVGEEYDVLEEVWEQGSCSLETLLVEIVEGLSEEVCSHFSVKPPPSASPDVLAHLFWAANEAMHILIRTVPAYPIPGRLLRILITAAANLFTTTDLADILFTQTSARCIAAQQTRQSCIVLIRTLADIPEPLPGGRNPAEFVLRTLLEHGLHSGDHEPAHHLLQVFCLIDFLLPTSAAVSTSVAWSQKVLPNVLRELWTFCRALDTENKAHLVRRLVAVDNGSIGIGDWLLQEELKDLSRTLRRLGDFAVSPHEQLLSQYQVSLSLRFLLDLLTASSSECNQLLISNASLARSFAGCLRICLAENIVSAYLRSILNSLAAKSEMVPDVLKLDLALAILRGCQHSGVTASDVTTYVYVAHAVLIECPSDSLTDVADEISSLLHSLESSGYIGKDDLATALVGLLEWFAEVEGATLAGYDTNSLGELFAKLEESLDPEKREALAQLSSAFKFTDDVTPVHAPTILPDTISLGLQDLEDLLRPKTAPPTTPPRKSMSQDILALVAISPPTAVIRSPAATGLTKTYSNNDFRQLRQTPSARQNTSRLPSMHVDDFENAAMSPTLPSLPMPVPVPLAGGSGMGALPLAPETFASVSPVFKLL